MTAGVGNFRGDLVAARLKGVYGSIDAWTMTTSSTFLSNPQFSKIADAERGGSYESYLLPGGVQSMLPNPPIENYDPLVVVHSSPAAQLEFKSTDTGTFFEKDCRVYGNRKYFVGVKLCIAANPSVPGTIIAG